MMLTCDKALVRLCHWLRDSGKPQNSYNRPQPTIRQNFSLQSIATVRMCEALNHPNTCLDQTSLTSNTEIPKCVRAISWQPECDYFSLLSSYFNENVIAYTRVGTLLVATIYLQLIQNRYIFRSFTVLQCSHQHCVQPVASDVEVVGYL